MQSLPDQTGQVVLTAESLLAFFVYAVMCYYIYYFDNYYYYHYYYYYYYHYWSSLARMTMLHGHGDVGPTQNSWCIGLDKQQIQPAIYVL